MSGARVRSHSVSCLAHSSCKRSSVRRSPYSVWSSSMLFTPRFTIFAHVPAIPVLVILTGLSARSAVGVRRAVSVGLIGRGRFTVLGLFVFVIQVGPEGSVAQRTKVRRWVYLNLCVLHSNTGCLSSRNYSGLSKSVARLVLGSDGTAIGGRQQLPVRRETRSKKTGLTTATSRSERRKVPSAVVRVIPISKFLLDLSAFFFFYAIAPVALRDVTSRTPGPKTNYAR